MKLSFLLPSPNFLYKSDKTRGDGGADKIEGDKFCIIQYLLHMHIFII